MNFGGTNLLESGLLSNVAILFPASARGIHLLVEPVERLHVATRAAQANGNKYGIDSLDLGRALLIDLTPSARPGS